MSGPRRASAAPAGVGGPGGRRRPGRASAAPGEPPGRGRSAGGGASAGRGFLGASEERQDGPCAPGPAPAAYPGPGRPRAAPGGPA